MPIRTSSALPKEAKLFRNNRSQAVRIPVEFELRGDRVLIHRDGYAFGLTLVTDNARAFSRISGLTIENWLEQ